MESAAHQRLKHFAMLYARAHRCAIYAAEVTCPIARYRVDVACYLDRGMGPFSPTLFDHLDVPSHDAKRGTPSSTPARTVIIECKQSRADFLKDSEDEASLITRRSRLVDHAHAVQREWGRLLRPDTDPSTADLFGNDPDPALLEQSRPRSYKAVAAELARIDRVLEHRIKHASIARYRLADQLYIAAPKAMIKPSEVPAGWGLLECSSRTLRSSRTPKDHTGLFRLVVPAPHLGAPDKHRARLLRNIAAQACAANTSQQSNQEKSAQASHGSALAISIAANEPASSRQSVSA